ncbi:MAG: hypothetical protein OHK0039_07600 [Bacteroidia bacterium]
MAQPSANFVADTRAGCSPLTVHFTDLSSGTIHTWFWDFGNGNTSVYDDVIATYTTPGTYTVSLTVTDTIAGLSSTRTEVAFITVYEDPDADFVADTTSGCAPLAVQFSDRSTPGNAAIASYLWDFGDGNLGSGPDPQHVYTTAGDFTVTLVVIDANGCSDTRVYNDLVSVTEVAQVSFAANPTTGCAAPLVVNFTSTVTPAGSYSYLWDFGDGTTSSAPNPTHVYNTNGDYSITLTITDANGCQEQVRRDNYILINQPVADFRALDLAVCTGQPVQFENLSTGANTYLWTFGDGAVANQSNPSHTYTLPGTYTVSLLATNPAGCDDFHGETAYITVYSAPGASFIANDNTGCTNPFVVTFSDNSFGDIVAWMWDFGNGNFSTGPNPTTTYTVPGTYTVSLTITSDDGCQATETIPNYIVVGPPQAAFDLGPLDGCVPLTVNFLDLSTSPADPIVSWVWNFGDGGVSNQQNPSYTYAAAGQYSVSLTVTTASGCQDTEVFQYVMAGTRPTANFNANTREVCVNQVVNFTDLSTGGATAWFWNFGDGGVSFVQSPAYTYQDTGYFAVSLVVEYLGCPDTLIRDSFIHVVGPLADFTMNPANACNPPTLVSFFDESGGATAWNWTFGDGGSSSLRNPTHTYLTTGNFQVTLVVTDSVSGCVNQAIQNIPITNPDAGFTVNDRLGCAPFDVQFTNTSTQANGYLWSFGDGATSTAANPAHTYAQPGLYTVRLIASDGVCSDTLLIPNYVRVIGASANFTASTLTGCAPLAVTFNDTSVPFGSATIVGWQWTFGDGNTSSQPNPTHVYAAPGSYSVSLTVLDDQGCQATLTRNQYITPTFPTANFVTTDTVACPGAFISFTSLSTGVGLSYLWDFGDGTTATTPNPTHLYPGNGIYHVSLQVTDVNGCSDTRVRMGYVNIGQPTASFTADTTSATCPPLTVNFLDQSSPNVVAWYWDFGDGSTSILRNPSKIYTAAGDYTVRLIVTTAQGCQDTLIAPDLIQIQGPTGAFTFFPSTGCRPLNVDFAATSPNPLWTYSWDFGDGTGALGMTANHTYYTDTTISPILLIEDADGCVVYVRNPNNITIRPLPRPAFTVNQTQICLGETVHFTNVSTSKRPIVTFAWDFGDGNTSAVSNPSHTYLDTGLFYVNLLLTTVDGCQDTATVPVQIRVTAPPTAYFDVTPSAACVPFAATFTEASTSAFSLASWQWTFGDGNTATGQVIAPHIYTTAGTYQASLVVTDTRGCTGAITRAVQVHPLPTVNFSADRYGCAPIVIDFTDSTLGSSPAIAWLWNFGDGQTSTLQHPTHSYASDGTYTVSLAVTDARGCVGTHTKPGYIRLEHPVANFTSNAGITCPPQTVQFTNASTSSHALTYFWDFGDGFTSTQRNPAHTYYTSDTFTVTLIVTDIYGCSDTLVRPDHVINHDRPTASFTVSDDAACVPENIVFTSTSTPAGASLTTFLWDFGTGSGTTTPVASFLYVNPGTYTARLIVTDAHGCRDTASRSIHIHPNPNADFRAGDTVGCAIATISFTDLTTGVNAPVAWAWTFGNGHFATTQNPANTYYADGVYSVKLVVTDINGCRDSITRTNYIRLDHPDADFTLGQVQACPGTAVQFTDQSTGPFPVVHWMWNYGDGSPTGLAQHPAHTYVAPGLYNVSLIVTDALNCRDTVVRPSVIQVHTGPTAGFTYAPQQGCEPLTVNFQSTATAGSLPIVQHQWTFGDGGSALVANPTYAYSVPGVYTVRLIVIDGNGCADTLSQSVQVLEKPVVNFVADKTAGCGPETIRFTDLTTSPYLKVAWLWTFGDGNTSTSPAPVHTYLNDGVYTVKLVVTDQNGCKDSLTRTNYIRLEHPVAHFTYDESLVCPNLPVGVTFTDASTGPRAFMGWSWQFGDGSTSVQQHPSYAYATPGVYTVILQVTDVLGCSDTDTQSAIITVLDPPKPAFIKSDSANCTPLTVTLTDQTLPGAAAVVGWRWTFGNGDSSLVQHPTYTWTTPGIYTVHLTATDMNGCEQTVSSQVRAYQIPVVNFRSNDTLGCAPRTVTFVNQSTAAFPIVWRRWYFGDGDSATNVINPTHTYAADGVYTVTLVIEDANGCRDTLVRPDYIRLTHPVADFTYDQAQVCPGIPVGVTFTDLSVADHPLTGWQWSFGDGGVSNLQHPSHSYAVPGIYSVRLIVTNNLGCRDTLVVPSVIRVLTPPTAGFATVDTADCVPFSLQVLDQSLAGDAPIQSWLWNFGNGQTSPNPAPLPQTYATPGVYTVTLTTTDANGCTDSHALQVEAYGLPVANFRAHDTVGCAPMAVSFTDLTTGPAAIASWFWEFGDGNTSTLKDPVHTYAADGVYTVRLTVVDIHGCSHSLTRTNYIRLDHPDADFAYNQTVGCPGLTVQFTDLSTAPHALTSWLWDFGDGHSSTAQHPSHTYHLPGLYTVRLTVGDAEGCGDTETKANIIRIWVRPTAASIPGDTAGCAPFVATFRDNSTAGSVALNAWNWTFGNGNTSTGVFPPAQTYATPGVYTLTLRVADANGCRDTATYQVEAYANPVADFAASDTVGCAPTAITFTDLSAGPVAIVAWLWNFGDSNTSTQQSPTHTYAADGAYTVSLTVTDANGCSHTRTRTQYIRLIHPVAAFTYNTFRGCPGTTITFTDVSTSTHPLTAWLWDFGDGATSTQQHPSHTYTTPGTYTVRLTVTDNLACSDEEVKTALIRIWVPPTAATLPGDVAGCSPFVVDFADGSTAGDGPLVAWTWDFGNGNSSTSVNPAPQTFSPAGSYTVQLVVRDNNSCRDTVQTLVQALAGPAADFASVRTMGCAPQPVQFSDLSGGPAPIVAWLWNFGDGQTSTQQHPSHTYMANGTYHVTLIVWDANGCSDTLVRPKYIDLQLPVADFAAQTTAGCTGLAVNFSDLSAGPAPIVAWLWAFGDGTTSTQQHPAHVYANPGLYTVTLTITDSLGCGDVETKTNLVRVYVSPTAAFTMSDSSGCRPLGVFFNSTSVGNDAPITGIAWDFGDGTNGSGASIYHDYPAAGTYLVRMTATDANGCTATVTQTLRVHDLPTAGFFTNTTSGCAGTTVGFVNTSGGPQSLASWSWSFGDGGSSTAMSPSHTYTAAGSYTVQLVVEDVYGCRDTLARPQYVRIYKPVANFALANNQGCPGLTVSFTDLSSDTLPVVSWQWNFGDGFSSTLQHPTHTYTQPGYYDVRLIVTNSNGCRDTLSMPQAVHVYALPTAQFAPDQSADCAPFTVQFNDQSVANEPGAVISAWQWTFGDGGSSLLQHPQHSYPVVGSYVVQLTVSDDHGCTATTSQTVQSLAGPTAAFSASPRTGCAPQPVQFTDLSTGPYAVTAWRWYFGDGDSSSLRHPLHVYQSDGQYDVRLVVFDANGCSDTLLRTQYIRLSHPVANFGVSVTDLCPGDMVSFSDLSIPDTTLLSWQWTFGDGGTSTLQHPVHTYTSDGSYTVTLVVTNARGCTDTIQRTQLIDVATAPIAGFYPSDTIDCTPFSLSLVNTSAPTTWPITNYAWTFGNGQSSALPNPAVTYATPGTYTITLVATDQNGCTDTARFDVIATVLPTPRFAGIDSLGCAPQTVNFLNQSTGPYPFADYLWTFGDGATSTAQFPVHTYAADGLYTVSLRVTDVNGCSSTLTKPQYIRLSHPQADFTYSQNQICPGTQVQFADASLADTTLVAWLWDFGDGQTSTQQHPSHMYTTAGQYTVSLTVSNLHGCSDTETRTALIEVIAGPEAQFVPSTTAGCIPLVVSFQNTTVVHDAQVADWAWTFGNGQTATIAQPGTSYTTPGVYQVRLVATDAFGCRDTATASITAYGLPTAVFTASDSAGCAPIDITFYSQSSGPATLTSWAWTFGDGGTATSPVPVHQYLNDGVYTVGLIVGDQNGCRDTLVKPQYIRLSHPTADFTVNDDEICPGTTVQFGDLSVGDTTLMSWLWNFGDGTTSNLQNPSHAYQQPGLYPVSLTVTNLLGCAHTEVKTAYIEVLTPPTPAFAVSTPEGCHPLLVAFTDQSVGNPSPIASWSWTFGNGQTALVKNPTAFYAHAGTYPVNLTVVDFAGCSNDTTINISVYNRPQANFVASDTAGCAEFITFFDLSTGDYTVNAWLWDFGDGNTSNLQNPVHSYTSTGVYTVSLIVWDENGCGDTLVKPQYIQLSRPLAAFGQDLDVVCPGSPLQFVDISTPDFPLVAWYWTFGDGGTSTLQNPVHTYAAPGTYTVTLVITNVYGCTDTEVGMVEVLQPPHAMFAPSTLEDCTPMTVVFADQSQTFTAPLFAWQWHFGNNQYANQQHPTHTYTTPGTYAVTLTVIDGNGCFDDTTVTVVSLPNPVAGFTATPRVGCAPQAVQFTSNANGAFPIQHYFWDFGDGQTSTAQNPAHLYVNDGLYTVSLIVEDINGCRDTLVRQEYIRLRHPVANFAYSPAVGCPGLRVNFSDTSVPDTTLVSWLWTFGDGTTSTAQHPSHVYANPGVYSVSLTIDNLLGCGDTRTRNQIITVHTPPVAGFVPADTTGCRPITVSFQNQSTFSDGPITGYSWLFGTSGSSTLPNPTHTFASGGNHAVRLIATDLYGCRDTASGTVRARELPQPAFLASDSTGCSPRTISFFDQSLASAAIVGWTWDFGDGTGATTPFPVHTYQNDGLYTVALTITDANGCENTLVKPQYIRLTHPVANFSMGATQVCPGTAVQFIDASVADTTLVSWMWNFGDPGSGTANTSSLPNPTHVFYTPGTYTISLTVRNVNGCEDVEVKTSVITVLARPAASFVPSPQAGCVPLDVSFQNTTTAGSAPIATWLWAFGDGLTSIFTNPQQVYGVPGDYEVSLIATDAYGCRDTAEMTITVHVPPTAAFTATERIGCAPLGIQFLDQSLAGTGLIDNWRWSFGDGSISTSQFPSHTYAGDGDYTVTLEVGDANGCRDTVAKPQFVRLSHPVADFTMTSYQLCPNTLVSFLDASTPDTTLISWLWSFGDGTTSTLPNPTHAYATGGTYTVSLTVTNVLGCVHTVSKPAVVTILRAPQTVFTPLSNQGCTPFNASFADNSVGLDAPIVAWAWDFGNGGTSTAQHPSYLYTTPGTYTVMLTTTDNNGCTSSMSRQVTALTLPNANFMTVDTLSCAPETAQFFDLTTGQYPITSWSWSFGDGGTSTQQHPQHAYAADGWYDVRLIARDVNGCRDTVLKPDYVRLSNPRADFVQSDNVGCPGLTVQFTSTSFADTTLISWLWSFGDGTTSVVQHPDHSYPNPGLYTVSLTVTNAIGCTHTLTVPNAVRISTPPQADFLVADTLGCTPFMPHIADNSSVTSSPIVQWQWDLGNGATSTQQEPVYTYTVPGTYVLTLMVTDAIGCSDVASRTIVAAASPTALFTGFDTLGCAPQAVQFTQQSLSHYLITRYDWQFGDGGTSSLPNPNHTYTADGSYSVQLVIEDESGCTDTLLRPHYVRLSHPVADFVADADEGCEGTTVNFTFTGTPDTTITGYRWYFGDGDEAIMQNPTHSYTQHGDYDVSLVITNILGCRDTVVRPNLIDIFEPPVAAIRAADTSGCVPFQADFEDWSTSLYGITDWEWFINGAPKGESQNLSQWFSVVGTYEIMLVVTDVNGCTDTTVQHLYVRPVPVADFVVSDTLGCAPMLIQFTDLSQHRPDSWLWDFGDGTTSAIQNPVHTYAEDGIYTVRLSIVDRYGCSDEVEYINRIRLDHPDINFTVDYDPSCPPVEASFVATGRGLLGMAKWQWNFGDGITTTTLTDSVVHAYYASGVFDVSLIGTDSLNCRDTVRKPQLITVLGDIIPDPIELHAVSVLSNTQIEIRFAPHQGADFKQYTIYREDPTTGYVPIYTTAYIYDTVFIDQQVQANLQSYCYKVTASNYCDSESELGRTEAHCSIDLVATPVPGEIILTWNPYQGWNEVVQYEVYRVESYSTTLGSSFIGIVPGSQTRFSEPFEHCFNNVAYRVKAVGVAPQEVAWSDTAQAVNAAGIRGDATEVVRATVEDNARVLVEWRPFDLPGQTTVYVERAIDGGAYRPLMTLPAGEQKFNDRDVEVSRFSYGYRVQAQDSCGNKTPISNEGKSILLTAEQSNGVPVLHWTAYSAWRFGVQEYVIEVFNDTTGSWHVVDRVQGTVLSYEDRGTTLDQPQYCYRVWAVEMGGNSALSLSNEACVRVESKIYAPNAFTPNNDGINDVFYLSGYHVQSLHLQVFSRWGLLLFETYDISQGWDGTYKGQPVGEGVYVYVVRGVRFNGQTFTEKGSLTLIR